MPGMRYTWEVDEDGEPELVGVPSGPGEYRIHIPPMTCGLGAEPSVEAFIGHLVLCFRECRRVLREDGVMWVVIGDSFGGGSGVHLGGSPKANRNKGATQAVVPAKDGKQGNLLAVPYRLLLALQADGWLVRQDLVWSKTAPMPESVAGWRWERHRVKVTKGARASNQYREGADGRMRQGPGVAARAQREAYFEEGVGMPHWADCPGCPKCAPNGGYVLRRGSWRHTRSHETILMLTKQMGYWSDGERVQEPSSGQTGLAADFRRDTKDHLIPGQAAIQHRLDRESTSDNGHRNPRDVLTPSSSPYKGSHYATFPLDLVRPLLLASCPLKCCPACGAGWAPVVERTDEVDTSAKGSRFDQGKTGVNGNGRMQEGERYATVALGYRPTCDCDAGEPVPGLVLDPFCGSGTTLLAARELGLRGVGCDLSAAYLRELAAVRALGRTPAGALAGLPLFGEQAALPLGA